MRLLLSSAVFCGALVFAAQSSACSIARGGHVPAAELRDSVDYLFKGIPIRTRKIGGEEAVTTYKILTVYKGYDRLNGSTVELRHRVYPAVCPFDVAFDIKSGWARILMPTWEDGAFHVGISSTASDTLDCEFDALLDPKAKCSPKELEYIKRWDGSLPPDVPAP